MRIIEVELFKFNELSENIQEKVLDNLRGMNLDHSWWDFVYDDCTAHLEELGFEDIKISFSGFWSQGDGASFSFSNADFDKICPKEFIELKGYDIRLSSRRSNGWCAYDHSIASTIGYDVPDELEEKFREFEEWFEEYHRDLSHEIYKKLENEYEFLTSNECLRDTIDANEYEFDSEGNLA